jgi:hypothetical protein
MPRYAPVMTTRSLFVTTLYQTAIADRALLDALGH